MCFEAHENLRLWCSPRWNSSTQSSLLVPCQSGAGFGVYRPRSMEQCRPCSPSLQLLVRSTRTCLVDQKHGPNSRWLTSTMTRWPRALLSAHVLSFILCLPLAGLSPPIDRSLRRSRYVLRSLGRGTPLPGLDYAELVGSLPTAYAAGVIPVTNTRSSQSASN